MMTSLNGNIFRVTGPLCGEFTVPVEFPAQGQWRGALMCSLICAWINDWVNNREAGDLRHHRGHYDVNVMIIENIIHYNDVTWVTWRPKSTASRLFAQTFVHANIIENMKAGVTDHLCGESTGHQWPVYSPHKWPIARKPFQFNDVIMSKSEGIILQFLVHGIIRVMLNTNPYCWTSRSVWYTTVKSLI